MLSEVVRLGNPDCDCEEFTQCKHYKQLLKKINSKHELPEHLRLTPEQYRKGYVDNPCWPYMGTRARQKNNSYWKKQELVQEYAQKTRRML